MNIQIFVQARMESTRLPGKVLKQVLGKPLLGYLTERLSRVTKANSIHVLTTTQSADDKIVDFCNRSKISVYRGPNEDVLTRYYKASLEFKPDAIVRITGDCPLIDPEIIDEVISAYQSEYPHWDYVSNSLTRSFPRGLDVEIFSFNALEKAYKEAIPPSEREHVTLYMYRNSDKFRCKNVSNVENLSLHRWTVDTPEDFTLIKLIIENLYPENKEFNMENILNLLKLHKDWIKINSHINQKVV